MTKSLTSTFSALSLIGMWIICLLSHLSQFLQTWVEKTGSDVNTASDWLAVQWTGNSNQPIQMRLYSWAAIYACPGRDCSQHRGYVASVASSKVGWMLLSISSLQNLLYHLQCHVIVLYNPYLQTIQTTGGGSWGSLLLISWSQWDSAELWLGRVRDADILRGWNIDIYVIG
jgi:hypothetical protein